MPLIWECAGAGYSLPLGAQPFTLTVSNCAGISSCTSIVTVEDQEPVTATGLDCGNLPPNGVLDVSIPDVGKETTVAAYTPTYAKANGCPADVSISQLTCSDCLLGFNKEVS